MGFLTDIENSVTSGFGAVATAFGSGLLSTFRPLFITGFTIWITLIAYEVAFGKSEDGATYLFTKIGKIFLIGVLALYGWPEVSGLLNGIKDGWVGGSTMSNVLETNLMTPVAELWARLFDWFTAALRDVGWTELGRLISTITLFALLFCAFTSMTALVSAFGAIALAMYLVANSVFILLMAIGPFFLLCLAFPFTQRFFETYIGNVMTSIFAMAFTVLMVMFVANLFGLVGIQNIVPSATDEATVATEVRSMAVLFAAKAAMSLLIIYLYYKVFDLAAALGGGLNMGNNMVGGVRAILRDAQRGSAARQRPTNQIGNGGGGSNGGGNSGDSGRSQRRSGPSTLTGMAMNAMSPAISGVARAGIAAGSGAGSVGRYAYNRYSQISNRGNTH
ncbi:type IV secretion system protein [Paracidovorax citrulli]|uniref:type IV secretion system protein n=1 Tax=Paracidovorax citrulli TaxID=80869 RepID=UPI00066470F1|nr:type IV secretion system protein [Paracidovorax citrulli]QCX13147.1 Type IV secretion protein TrbL/VirB6 plasmid conjugal transfer protein [Paracidovorax citrulli]UMT93531.1 type IV secretion system protein [Paracidovorax citrulli]